MVRPGPAGWALTLAVSLTYMFLGAKLWARHPRSAELTGGELVPRSWARRRRAESTLERNAGLLDYEIPSFLDPQTSWSGSATTKSSPRFARTTNAGTAAAAPPAKDNGKAKGKSE